MVQGIQTPGGVWSHQGRINQDPSFAYFNPKADHVIQVDGSRKGLGAILLHKGRPVIYVSRMLMPAVTSYPNIKRELLSIVFGLDRLHHYIFGSKVRVQTDHKSLIPIWKKVNCSSHPLTSMTIAQTGKIWCETDISEGQRQHYCRHPQPSQSTWTRGGRQRLCMQYQSTTSHQKSHLQNPN